MTSRPEDHRPVAVITGGSSGIGRAIATALARRGYFVAIVGRTGAKVAESAAAARLGAGNDSAVLELLLDVVSESDMAEMAQRLLSRFGRIDLLVASAGIGRSPGSTRVLPYPLQSLPLHEWRTVIDVNLTGVFLANRSVVPIMRRQGCGRIMNIGSSTTPTACEGPPMPQPTAHQSSPWWVSRRHSPLRRLTPAFRYN